MLMPGMTGSNYGGAGAEAAGGASEWALPALMSLSSLAGAYGNQQNGSSMMLPMMLMMMQDRKKKNQMGPTVGPGSAGYADYSNPVAQTAMQGLQATANAPSGGLPIRY